jgi:Ankyrin repeats (3 copies)/Ankyrin repeats (many copies)
MACELIDLRSYYWFKLSDRFRWIFCQLETLRYCLPPSVRSTLRELPESLDETYERILKEIKKPNRGHARRVLQCLVVAIRPLRVAELAEVLAVDFDDAEGIPKLNADWRWEDQEQALLIACSSLIAVVESEDSRVVQFSHFSVKEFLTSSRLATVSGEASNYHIDLEPAHTTLAQACLGVLLRTHSDVDGHTPEDHPLSQYAARHWVTHTQFADVSSRLQNGMEYLFDPDKPHFKVWHTIYDIDTPTFTSPFFPTSQKSAAAPLYYATLCGFHDLVEHLIIKYPEDVNASGGSYVRPLVAALAKKHFRTAELLRHSGADLHCHGGEMMAPLHLAAEIGDVEVIRKIIEYGVDINAKDLHGCTPLHVASDRSHHKDSSVHRFLLEHGADVNARRVDGSTPLHNASQTGVLEVVRLLLEQGADVKAEDNHGATALQVAETYESEEVKKLLLEHKAK